MINHRNLLMPAAMALVFAAAPAFAATTATEKENPAGGSARGHENPAEMQAFSTVKVAIGQAIAAVQKQASGNALGATFETMNGSPTYDVLVFANNAEVHYKVDANNGTVTAGSEPSVAMAKLDQEDTAEVKAIQSAKVDLAQAVSAAEQKGGGKAIDASIEDRHGTAAYDIQTVKSGKLQMFTVDLRDGQAKMRS